MKDLKNLNDSELVLEFIYNHNNKAFDTIFDRYFLDVYRFIYSRTGNRQLSEDLVSETFTTLLDVIKSFSSSNLKSFIIGIAFNKVRQSWRNVNKELYLDEEIAASEEEDLEEVHVETHLLYKVLNELPDRYRQVLEKRYIQSKDLKEICEEMEITNSTLRVLFHRALKKAAQIANQYKDERN